MKKFFIGREHMSLVIGLGGLLTAGKDVVADHLVDKYGFVKMGMSDPLADALYVLNPRILIRGESEIVKEQFVFDQIYSYQDIIDVVGYVEAKTIPEVRSWLQKLGTEVGRDMLGKNIWVDAAEKKIRIAAGLGRNVVITGIRFPNELEMINDLNSIYTRSLSVWVERDTARNTSTSQHASEGSVRPDQFDCTLINDKDIPALHKATDDLLENIKNV